MGQLTDSPSKSDRIGSRPVHTIRYSAVRAAIWRNVIDNGNASWATYSITFSRSYKDGNDWKETNTFGRDDLLVLAKAADEAHTWISQQRLSDAEPGR